MNHTVSTAARQRGAATLALVMGLLLVMALTAATLQRSLVAEHKTASHQMRAVQAQEAAEAGLEWTLAALNGVHMDAHCRPNAEGKPLRERALTAADAYSGQFQPVFDPAHNAAPACTRTQARWQCRCPASGRALPPEAEGDTLQPAFRVELAGAADPSAAAPLHGLVRLTAFGCAHAGPAFCADDQRGEPGRAIASVQAALLPALAVLPAAPLTATGEVDFGTSPVGLHNPDPRSGLLVQAGGTLRTDNARLSPPPGTPAAAALLDHDASLASRPPERLLQFYLGMPRSTFEQLPGVAVVSCADDCSAALRQAVRAGHRLLLVKSDLAVRDIELGNRHEPLLLVADGDVRFGAGVRFTGFLFGRSLQWQAGSGGHDALHGAAVLAGPVNASGEPEFVRDHDALKRLQTHTGTYVRVPGTWKDTL